MNNDISSFIAPTTKTPKKTPNSKRGSGSGTSTAPPLHTADVDYFGDMGITASPFSAKKSKTGSKNIR